MMTQEQFNREVVATLKAGWCQGTNARNAEGEHVPTHSPDATNFCLHGALRKVEIMNDLSATARIAFFNNAIRRLRSGLVDYPSLAGFNDSKGRTQQEVVNFASINLGVVDYHGGGTLYGKTN